VCRRGPAECWPVCRLGCTHSIFDNSKCDHQIDTRSAGWAELRWALGKFTSAGETQIRDYQIKRFQKLNGRRCYCTYIRSVIQLKLPPLIAKSKTFILVYSTIALILILHCISNTIHSSLTLFNSSHFQFTRQYSITYVLKSLQVHQPSSVESPPRQHRQDWRTGIQPH
jgi:hypothetical protein